MFAGRHSITSHTACRSSGRFWRLLITTHHITSHQVVAAEIPGDLNTTNSFFYNLRIGTSPPRNTRIQFLLLTTNSPIFFSLAICFSPVSCHSAK